MLDKRYRRLVTLPFTNGIKKAFGVTPKAVKRRLTSDPPSRALTEVWSYSQRYEHGSETELDVCTVSFC